MSYELYPDCVSNKCTYFDTFDFQGETYYLNTFVKLKKKAPKPHSSLRIVLVQIVENGLTMYGNPYCVCAFWNEYGGVTNIKCYDKSPEDIIESIVEPSDRPPMKQKKEYYKDPEDSEVMIGWALYIFVMLFGVVFHDFGVLWVFATVMFFGWRKKRLTKPTEGHDYGFNNFHEKVREWNEWKT